MRVIVSPAAEADLVEIDGYIGQDSARSARRQIELLTAACLSLADAPKRFAAVRTQGGTDIRRAVRGHYSIFYVVRDTDIYILHILHAARDADRIFGEED